MKLLAVIGITISLLISAPALGKKIQPPPTPSTEWVVVDSQNQVIPLTIHDIVSDGYWHPMVEVYAVYYSLFGGVLYPVPTIITNEGFNTYDYIMFMFMYTESFCTGDPYVKPAHTSNTSMMIRPRAELVYDPNTPDEFNSRIPYLAPAGEAPIVAIKSVMTADGCVNVLMPSGEDYVLEPAFSFSEGQYSDNREDLHALYPPPYHVCRSDDTACINYVAP